MVQDQPDERPDGSVAEVGVDHRSHEVGTCCAGIACPRVPTAGYCFARASSARAGFLRSRGLAVPVFESDLKIKNNDFQFLFYCGIIKDVEYVNLIEKAFRELFFSRSLDIQIMHRKAINQKVQ